VKVAKLLKRSGSIQNLLLLLSSFATPHSSRRTRCNANPHIPIRFPAVFAGQSDGYSSLSAQGTTASLGGTVTDTTGAVIPAAQVVLKNEAGDDRRTSNSNGSGVFSFSAVPTGTYDVTISAPGFKGFQQNGIHLNPGDQSSVRDIHLEPGGANETVEVNAAANSINFDSGEQSSLIS
jgi:hypothetical protein